MLELVLEGVKLDKDWTMDCGEGEYGGGRVRGEAAVLQDMLGMEADWAEKPI